MVRTSELLRGRGCGRGRNPQATQPLLEAPANDPVSSQDIGRERPFIGPGADCIGQIVFMEHGLPSGRTPHHINVLPAACIEIALPMYILKITEGNGGRTPPVEADRRRRPAQRHQTEDGLVRGHVLKGISRVKGNQSPDGHAVSIFLGFENEIVITVRV